MPPEIPKDFQGDVYEHTRNNNNRRKMKDDYNLNEEEQTFEYESCANERERNLRTGPEGGGFRVFPKMPTSADEVEDEDEDEDENSEISKRDERLRELVREMRARVDLLDSGNVRDLSENLGEVREYLESIEKVLDIPTSSSSSASRMFKGNENRKKRTVDIYDRKFAKNEDSGLTKTKKRRFMRSFSSFSSSSSSLLLSSTAGVLGTDVHNSRSKKLLRLDSVQKFPNRITSIKFTRHRDRDLKMEIYGEFVEQSTKVVPRIDDVVPKIALVGDERGSLFALDVKSGEILARHDYLENAHHHYASAAAITSIESYVIISNSSSSSSSSSNKKFNSFTRIVLGRAGGSVTFLTMEMNMNDNKKNGGRIVASLKDFSSLEATTLFAKKMRKEGTTSSKASSEALSRIKQNSYKLSSDTARIVASHVAVLSDGERRVILANGKGEVVVLKEFEEKVVIDVVIYSANDVVETKLRGRIVSFQSIAPSVSLKLKQEESSLKTKADVVVAGMTSAGEVLLVSLSSSSMKSSTTFEKITCDVPERKNNVFSLDGDFEPNSSSATTMTTARVVLSASKLAYLEIKENEDQHFKCSISRERPLKFGISLRKSSAENNDDENDTTAAENDVKVVSLRDGVAVFSKSFGIRAYETNNDFTNSNDESDDILLLKKPNEKKFAKDGAKFSWAEVLYDVTEGEDAYGDDDDDDNENDLHTKNVVATGDGRRTIAFALSDFPSVLVFYRWQGGMSEIARTKLVMRQRQRDAIYSSTDAIIEMFAKILESKITATALVFIVAYHTYFFKTTTTTTSNAQKTKVISSYEKNTDPIELKRDSRKIYREFDAKQFRKDHLM